MPKEGLQVKELFAKTLLASHYLGDWTQLPTMVAIQDIAFSSPAPLVALEHTWLLITPTLPQHRQ